MNIGVKIGREEQFPKQRGFDATSELTVKQKCYEDSVVNFVVDAA